MESELSERKPCAKYTMAQHNRNGVPKAWRCRPSQVCAGGAALARAALATALARGLEGDFERGVGLEGDLERGDGLAGDLEREGGKTGDLERRVGMVPFFSTTLNFRDSAGGALPVADTRTANSRGHMRSRPPSSADSSSGVGCIGSDAAQQQLLRG